MKLLKLTNAQNIFLVLFGSCMLVYTYYQEDSISFKGVICLALASGGLTWLVNKCYKAFKEE